MGIAFIFIIILLGFQIGLVWWIGGLLTDIRDSLSRYK